MFPSSSKRFSTLSRTSTIMSRASATEGANAAWLWSGDGLRTSWDGLRKDADLWDPAGDCLVYLYARATSKRPASIRLPLRVVEESRCRHLLAQLDESASLSAGSASDEAPSPTTASSSSSSDEGEVARIYLGAPKGLSRDETYNWHVTTRNLFALLLHRPLVGPYLGAALSDLLDRLALWRGDAGAAGGAGADLERLLAYADAVGYTRLAAQPDHAAAMLVFAQEQRLRSLWVDAFTHCVGMHLDLGDSPDYDAMGAVNRALIAKSALQMDLGLEAKSHAIGTLLEDDFRAHLGLTPSARQHLDDFRSFLHAYLVASHGYWPPLPDRFAKRTYTSVAEDLEALYDLVADFHTRDDPSQRQPVTGGLCVLQSVEAFDDRHAFAPLGSKLPLLPSPRAAAAASGLRQSYRSSVRGLIGGRDVRASALTRARSSFAVASNGGGEAADGGRQRHPLHKAFLDFEAGATAAGEGETSIHDGRKVRWMLIYAMVQMLRSVLHASPEVSDRDAVSYPLCCDTTDLPKWDREVRQVTTTSSSSSSPPRHSLAVDDAARGAATASSSHVSLHPDGETDYDRYFSLSYSNALALPYEGHDGDDAAVPSGLRRIMPLRTKSQMSVSGLFRPRTLSRVFSSPSVRRASVVAAAADDDAGEDESNLDFAHDGTDSPVSEAPSLDWSRQSQSSRDEDASSAGRPSVEAARRRPSASSSVYSEAPAPPQAPSKPANLGGDVRDKGLALDDFICPGLY